MPPQDGRSPQGDAALAVRVARRLRGFRLDVAFSSGRETVVLFGPSGGGKSLTLKAIAGIVRPEAGRIEVGGRLLYDSDSGVNVPPHERRVGYVPQGYALFPHLSVAENIAYGLRGLERGARLDTVREMVALTGLAGLEERRTRQLSGGQQQRVAVARAIAKRPKLLFCDEPTGSLDTESGVQVLEAIAEVTAAVEATTMIVSHNTAIGGMADRIVRFRDGRIAGIEPNRRKAAPKEMAW
ncbi:MAG TPA: ATP-binding cassette domain-containing protein [Dehalococcoidia bacterium]|nr:ATP-binding cassette domain-containing protein [Dehalococcoidia bacterium]